MSTLLLQRGDKCAAGKLKARDNYGNGRYRKYECATITDISVETAGKLERLITEPGVVAAELWQNRNNPALNVDHVGLRFILSLNGDNHLTSRVSPLIYWLDREPVAITTLARL